MADYNSPLSGGQVDESIKGSDITVADIATRDALNTNLFTVGKQCHVVSDGITYEWNGSGWDIYELQQVKFDITGTQTPSEGVIGWDNDAQTLFVGLANDVTLQVGQELYVRAKNAEATQINNGQAVYISGASGNRAEVMLANAGNTSALATIAISTEDISSSQNGFFTTNGIVRGLDTSAWAEGDSLYLSTTDGVLTNVKASAPNYCVCIGYVIVSHAVNGQIMVRISSNSKLGELSDVVTTGVSDGDILRYDSSTQTYKIDSGIYGEIHVHDNALNQSIPTGSTYTKIDKFTDNGISNGVTPDQTNNQIVLDKAGVYKVEINASFSAGTANTTWFVSGFLEGSELNNVHFTRKISTAGDVGSSSCGGTIRANAGDTLDVRVRHNNGGTVTILTVYGNLNVTYIGS